MPPAKNMENAAQEPKQSEPASKPVEPEKLASREPGIFWPLVICAILLLLIVFGIWRHMHQQGQQKDFAGKTGVVSVNYILAKKDEAVHQLILPGTVNAYTQAQLYARTNGYLSHWLVDIGDHVREGQVLAEIESPDIDAQLRQAVATQAQARANLDIARITYSREQELLARKVVSQQEYDQSHSSFDAARAALEAGEANVENLRVQQGFERITAPFTGKITTRAVDIGALVSQGGGTGTPLFGIAQTDPLRVYVNVPQTNYPSIRLDMPARLIVQEYPGRYFDGKVARFSGAIDPASRTLLTEVDIPNPDGTLDAGMYGEVQFALKADNAPIIIKSDALVFQADGPQVVVVTDDGKVHRTPVQVGRDFGKEMEILDGLKENAKVVMNPTDDLTEGLQVQAKEMPPAPVAASSPQPSGVPSKSKG